MLRTKYYVLFFVDACSTNELKSAKLELKNFRHGWPPDVNLILVQIIIYFARTHKYNKIARNNAKMNIHAVYAYPPSNETVNLEINYSIITTGTRIYKYYVISTHSRLTPYP